MTGGEKLQAYLQSIVDKMATAGDQPGVRVGFLEGGEYPDGTSIPMVAVFNEFGTSKSPPRPFFRIMIKTKAPAWGSDISKVLKATKYDVAQTLGHMGARIQRQLMQSITDLVDPPNAPSTIARKGFSQPLIDTGTMRNSVAFEVTS